MSRRSRRRRATFRRPDGTGEHYQAVLRILDAAEVDLAEARRAEARARAQAERAEREAAARAEAIAASIPEMVVIPAGTFRMGCVTRGSCDNDERPVHEVRVAAFELSNHEVTFAQWDVCTEYGDCRWVNDEGWGRGERPVINVNWHDGQQYLQWLSRETGESFRLPSEAEWEYAARAGTETRYWWGNDIGGAGRTAKAVAANGTMRFPRQWARFRRTDSDYTTFTATCSSGCRIAGTTVTAARLRMAVRGRVAIVHSVSGVAVRGHHPRSPCECLFAETATPTDPTVPPAFA